MSITLLNETFCKPRQINLCSINENWSISYIAKVSQRIQLKPLGTDHLSLYGNIDNNELCCQVLKKWLFIKAKLHLPELLNIISLQTKLDYRKVSVRRQKTVWGSCNSMKNISLNYQLLLLPYSLTRYILIHELCHTKFLNHSKEFWALVGKHMPDYEQQKALLKKAEKILPAWL